MSTLYVSSRLIRRDRKQEKGSCCTTRTTRSPHDQPQDPYRRPPRQCSYTKQVDQRPLAPCESRLIPTLDMADTSTRQARLLSIVPLALQNGFAMIHKSRVPDQNKRGRLFEAAVDRLVTWWCETFFSVTHTGHIRSRTFEEVEDEIALASEANGSESDDSGYERIRSVESLMKHVLMQRGSRDTSAQLFTALCRGLDIPARLVVSLQSVPWKSNVGKSAAKRDGPKGKGKTPQRSAGDDHEDLVTDDQSEADIAVSPSKYKGTSRTDHVCRIFSRKNVPSPCTHGFIPRKGQGDGKPNH